MDRTRVRRRRLALCLLGAGLLALTLVHGAGAGPSSGRSSRPVARGTYVVRSGDTLWGIADRYSTGDPRAMLDRIAKRNGVSSEGLVPGQTLVLLASP